MGYPDIKITKIPFMKATNAVVTRLQMVDPKWVCLTPDRLNQSCPAWKYVYETTERNLRQRKKNIAAMMPSAKPTPRPSALKNLISKHYTSSPSANSEQNEEDKSNERQRVTFNVPIADELISPRHDEQENSIIQPLETSLVIPAEPNQYEKAGTSEPTYDQVIACRRKIKQLRKELAKEERLLNEFRK